MDKTWKDVFDLAKQNDPLALIVIRSFLKILREGMFTRCEYVKSILRYPGGSERCR